MHKTEYEMHISDWSSDVCSTDLSGRREDGPRGHAVRGGRVDADAAFGDDDINIAAAHPDGEGGADRGDAPRARMDDERALRVLCDLEEGFALFEVEAANRLRVSDVEPGIGVEIDARSIGERQALKAADGGGICVRAGEALVDRDADQRERGRNRGGPQPAAARGSSLALVPKLRSC